MMSRQTEGEEVDFDDDEEENHVVLILGKAKLHADRRLLAKNSSYFAAMFQSEMIERHSGVVQLQEVCPTAMHTLISYSNTGVIDVQLRAVPVLLEVATMLQFDDVGKYCVERLLDNLGTANCLGIMNLADRLSLHDLRLRAKQVAMWYFEQVANESEILDIPLSYIVSYLSDDTIRVKSELQIFRALIAWIERDKSRRLKHLDQLISVVRFSQLTLKEIRTVTVHEIVKELPSVRSIVREIWKIRLGELSAERFGGSVTPLSNISPAESATDIIDAVGQNLASFASLEKIIRDDKVTAKRLLMTRARCIPTVPAFVKINDDKTRPPELVYFDYVDGRVKTIASLTKVFQKNHMALGFRACAAGNFVIVAGGEFQYGGNNWNMAAWKYNIFSKTWAFLCNLRNPRRHHIMCVLDDFVYIIGGIGRFRVVVNTAEKISITTGSSVELARLPNPVYSAVSVVYEGMIFVLDRNVYRYEPMADTWTHLKSVHQPYVMQLHSALAHVNGIYVVRNWPTEIELLDGDSLVVNVNPSNSSKPIGENQKYYTHVFANFLHKSENACIADEKMYSFGTCEETDGIVVESVDLCTGQLSIEYGCVERCKHYEKAVKSSTVARGQDEILGAANIHYGCFALPKYFV